MLCDSRLEEAMAPVESGRHGTGAAAAGAGGGGGDPRYLVVLVCFAAVTGAAAKHTPGAGEPSSRSVWTLLPRVLDRMLCDATLEEALAPVRSGRHTIGAGAAAGGGGAGGGAGGEDGVEALRCRALCFVEALVSMGRPPSSSDACLTPAGFHRQPCNVHPLNRPDFERKNKNIETTFQTRFSETFENVLRAPGIRENV
jgi:hypothetical protein